MDSFDAKMNIALQKLAADIIPNDERLKQAYKVSHTLFS